MKYVPVILALLLLAAPDSASADRRPNVILIMADDIGFECYSGYGSQFYSTPNIDGLAEGGVKFTHAYAQPLCTPSRVKIMTGRYNFRNYTTFGELDLSQPTFATTVKTAGYATAIAGKWQLSTANLNGPHQAGFDEYCVWHFGGGKAGRDERPPMFKLKGSRYKSPRLFKNSVEVPDTEGRYGPDMATEFICEFIERKKDEPFFVYYPMFLVHSPYDPTPDSVDWEETDRKRKKIDHFREMVHYMDRTIGRIVDQLEASGLREDTLLIVTGDNGTGRDISSPFPGRGIIHGGKGSMTDAGTRVAFVASWPGHIQSGAVVDSPIDFADVLPTIADVTGSRLPDGIDGTSFLPLLKGDSSAARGWIFISYSKNGLSESPYRCFVRNQEWKLYADGSLYYVPDDWEEQSPVTGTAGMVARQKLQPILDDILQQAPRDHISWTAGSP